MHRRVIAGTVILALGIAALTISGCQTSRINYEDSKRELSTTQALTVSESIAAGSLSEEPVTKASSLRHDALASLRNQGEGAAQAAELITKTFPTETHAVPFYVERIRVSGHPAMLIIEATGRSGGNLSDKRIWVIDDAGDVLVSGTR